MAERRLHLLRDRRGGHPRRRRAGDGPGRWPSGTSTRRRPTHVLVVPRAHHENAAALAAADPERAGRAGRGRGRGRREGRARRRLPPRLQHRRRGGPERLPHPPAPARRAPDDAGPPDEPGAHAWSRWPRPPPCSWPAAGRPETDDQPAASAGHLGEPGRGRPERRGSRGSRPGRDPDAHRQAQAAARGREAGDAGDAGGLHAVRAQRRRHRRLPLLHPRPEAEEGRLPHRHQHPPGQPGGGAPRDHVPAAAGRAVVRRAGRRRRAGPRLDLLRQHGLRRRTRRAARQRAVARRLGTGRQGGGRRPRLRHPARPRAPRSSCRCTTTC